jgi:alanine racemase
MSFSTFSQPSPSSRRPTWADVNLDQLVENCRLIRARTGPGVELMAMVKADAYGHGAAPVARRLQETGAADWFGVALPEEGIALRRAGVGAPILVLGGFWFGQEEEVLRHDLATTVLDAPYVKSLDRAAARLGMTARIHVEIDTGMGRLGIQPGDVPAFIECLRACPNVRPEGVMTHFASADLPEKDDFTRRQMALHRAAADQFAAAGFAVRWRHLANSAGTYAFAEAFGDVVRVGGALYGIAGDITSPQATAIPVKPALSLHSRIVLLKTTPAGTPLGYGGTFVTRRESRIATVPIGYGDGVHRVHSNRGAALVRGVRAPIVGRVSMDLTILDVTDVAGAELGDVATFIGRQGAAEISAEEYAATVGTIALEATATISARVPRCYVSEP